MGKKQKQNLFSANPWNDTPYFDMFEETWVKYGVIDTNSWYAIYDRNKPDYYDRLLRHEMFKWVERI